MAIVHSLSLVLEHQTAFNLLPCMSTISLARFCREPQQMFKCFKKLNEIKKNFISLISQKSTKMIFFSLFAIVNDNKGGNKGEKKIV